MHKKYKAGTPLVDACADKALVVLSDLGEDGVAVKTADNDKFVIPRDWIAAKTVYYIDRSLTLEGVTGADVK